MGDGFNVVKNGSSPQVRGRPYVLPGAGAATGLIPAGAGQTGAYARGGILPGAHPRRCGADSVRPGLLVEVGGSSPQVRGRRSWRAARWPRWRLIPAGAGQTRRAGYRRCRRWAHPRRCGADTPWTRPLLMRTGSSPQVRGRRHAPSSARPRRGLIPAGAGQTVGSGRVERSPRAHPRRCGADPTLRSIFARTGGSSPQVRGRPDRVVYGAGSAGLIPAGAGQTSAASGTPP